MKVIHCPQRFIPTRVGNTGGRARIMVDADGSSPRVWGIRLPLSALLPAGRFIPTRVGNTRPAATGRGRCGGSSPRVWGIRLPLSALLPAGRFIPTRVGNTKWVGSVPPRWPVHPHACGEYRDDATQENIAAGSSPRVWGIPFPGSPAPEPERFIPTRVGNTCRWGCDPLRGAVHPHACGEYGSHSHMSRRTSGSSPRVWGIHRRPWPQNPARRFIPTRVGNTPAG